MRLKKKLSLLLSLAMVTASVPTTTYAQGEPQLTKKAEWIDSENGLAKITLEVKGNPIETPKKGADVVVVMDYSGSMEDVISSETFTCGEPIEWTFEGSFKWFGEKYDKYKGRCSDGHSHKSTVFHGEQPSPEFCDKTSTIETTRWEASKNALSALLEQVIPTSEAANQVALVAFDSDVRSGYTNDFTRDKSSIVSTINSLPDPHPSSWGAPIEKGTNYVAALNAASNYIANRGDQSRPTYVVFLSDGEPDNGYEGVSQIQGLKDQGALIYTVGLDLYNQNAINRLKGYASQPAFFKNIDTPSDLDGLFSDIGETIASSVTIWDSIDTQYFTVVNKSGEDVSYEASNGNDKVQFSNGEDFVWNFENFSSDGETLVIYLKLNDAYLNTSGSYPTNREGSAYGQYVGEDGADKTLFVTQSDTSSPVPQLPTEPGTPIYAVKGTIDNGGTVSNGNQSMAEGSNSEAMVFAAATGYHISGITVNGEAQSLDGITTSYTYPSQTVTGAITVAVTTTKNEYSIEGTIDNGDVTNGSQTIDHGDSSEAMVFTAATGYHISGITVNGEAQSLDGITTTYTYPSQTVTGAITVAVATTKNEYSIKGTIDNGDVTNGSQTIDHGNSSEAMVFTAATGYHISEITVNGEAQSLDGITTGYTYPSQTVTGAITVAVTTEESDVIIGYQGGVGGTVTSASETLKAINGTASGSTATANEGYHFVDWRAADNTLIASGEGNEKLIPEKVNGVYEATTYYASFAKNSYGITGSIDHGEVTNGDQIKEYDSVSEAMVFTAATGYHISEITVNGEAQSLDGITTSYTYPSQTVTGAITVAVTTTKNEYSIKGTIDNGDVTNGSQTINHGDSSEAMVFTAATGYHISGITVNDEAQSLDDGITTSYTYPSQTVTGAITVAVTTTKNEYSIKGTIDNGDVTNGSQTINHGDSLEAMAFTAATGYHISGITVNGEAQSLDGITTSYTYPSQTATGSITVAVVTEEDDVTISYQGGTGGTVTLETETMKAVSGTAKGSKATADTGYHFVNWTNAAGDIVSTQEALVPTKGESTVYTDEKYTANFAEDASVTVTYIAGTGGAITNNTTGEVVSEITEQVEPITGNPVGTTAASQTGYDFVNWTNSKGEVVGTSYEFRPRKSQGIYVADTYTANFKKRYHNFVVEDIYMDLTGSEVDALHTIEGANVDDKIAFDSPISSDKDDYLRGYEYADLLVYVDSEEKASDAELSALGITVDREKGTLTGNLPDHQIWVKYIYNEVEKYDVTYTSEGKVTGIPDAIIDRIAGDEITVSADVPVREGYDFLGWVPQVDGTAIPVTDGKFIMPDGNVEIRASWAANEEVWNYGVEYYDSEGKLITTIPSSVLKRDPTVTSVEDRTPEGCKLQGYKFDGGDLTTQLNAEITKEGQTISVYYEKNDLIVKHVYGSNTVYDSKQSRSTLSPDLGDVVVNAVTSGRYTRIGDVSLNGVSVGREYAVTVTPDGESKYEIIFTYGRRSSSDSDDSGSSGSTDNSSNDSDSTPGDEVTIIEDPEVALQDSLEGIDHYAYVFGYEDGTVRPENKVTREEVATIFYRLLTDGTRDALFTRTQDFPDVAESRWSDIAIATLSKGSIVSGYPDGEFKPGNYITRAEFAAVVSKFDNLSYTGENQFNDIDGHWAASYINSAAIKGWINGYPDGSFHPDAYITRAEAITLINAVLDRQVGKDGLLPEAKYWSDNTADKWYYEAVMEATNSHDYERGPGSNVETWTAITGDKTWTER